MAPTLTPPIRVSRARTGVAAVAAAIAPAATSMNSRRVNIGTATSARVLSLGPRDVVIEPLAIRHDGVEERDAFRAVLHGMPDERNGIAGLEGGARPSLAPHDVG